MKIVLYIFLVLVLIVAGFFAWFFLFYLQVPELKITKEMSQSQRVEAIDAWFNKLQQEKKFNGVVFMSKDGEVLLSEGYGYTSSNKTEKLTSESSLRLASVSKQFTAAGILRLAEIGSLKLDDNITSYIPQLPYENVTIRNLLNQTSGIPDIYMDLAKSNKSKIDLLTNEIAVELVIDEQRKPVFEPNDKFQYSNTNYIILARVVEIVSGLSFEEFMKQEIFEPLDMKNTRVWNLLSKDSTFENKANDFVSLPGTLKDLKPTFIDGVAGDGAVFSSASDMLVWDKFWYGNELLDDSILTQAFGKPKLNDGTYSDYGFGWVVVEDGMWHNGIWLGAKTFIARNTAKKTCTAIFDNSSNLFFDKILDEIKRANVES